MYEERNRRRGETGERLDFVALFLESVRGVRAQSARTLFISLKHHCITSRRTQVLPFIKSGRLVKLSAEIMQRFVSHFCDTKRFQEVEACVVRLDPMQMDLNSLVRGV